MSLVVKWVHPNQFHKFSTKTWYASERLRSSQLWSNWSSCKESPEKILRLQWDSNPWPMIPAQCLRTCWHIIYTTYIIYTSQKLNTVASLFQTSWTFQLATCSAYLAANFGVSPIHRYFGISTMSPKNVWQYSLHVKFGMKLESVKPWSNGLGSQCKFWLVFDLRFVCANNLCGLALTLVELKSVCKSMQVFHHLATQRKSTQVDRKSSVYEWNLRLVWTCELTCESVWPPISSPHASSSFANLHWLVSPFGQGQKVQSEYRLESLNNESLHLKRTYLLMLCQWEKAHAVHMRLPTHHLCGRCNFLFCGSLSQLPDWESWNWKQSTCIKHIFWGETRGNIDRALIQRSCCLVGFYWLHEKHSRKMVRKLFSPCWLTLCRF